MASGNASNPSNNPNGQLPVTLFNGAQPHILDPNQYRLWRQRFEDMKSKLDIVEAQGEAAFARYNVVQRLESVAEAGRKAQVVLRAIQDGQLQVTNAEDTRRALMYTNNGNSMVNNAATDAYSVVPAIPRSSQYPTSIQASQAQASPVTAGTSANTFFRTQAQLNYIQHSSAGFNRDVRGSTSTQQNHVQAANRQDNHELDLARAELAARLMAYTEERGQNTQTQSNGNSWTGQFSHQQPPARLQTQQPYSLPQHAASGSNNAQILGLSVGSNSHMNDASTPMSSTHQRISGTTMASFTPPPSSSTVNVTPSENLSNSSMFYSNSSSSLAGALDDFSHSQASSTPYSSHGLGGNGAQAATQIDFSSHLNTPPHSGETPTVATQMHIHDEPTFTSAPSAQAAASNTTHSLKGAINNAHITHAQGGMVQSRDGGIQQVPTGGAHYSIHQAPQMAPAIAQQSQQTRAPTPSVNSSNVAHVPAYTSVKTASARDVKNARGSQQANPLLPLLSSSLPAPSLSSTVSSLSNRNQYQTGQSQYIKPTPPTKGPTFSAQPQNLNSQTQEFNAYNSFQQMEYRNNMATNIHGDPSTSKAQGGSGSSPTYQPLLTGQSTQPIAQMSDIPTPRTPQSAQNAPIPQLTPASADRKRLARDILRALGHPAKRKASKSPSPTSDDKQEPKVKRQALEVLPATPLETRIPVHETDSADEVERAMAHFDMSAVVTSNSAKPSIEEIALESQTIALELQTTALESQTAGRSDTSNAALTPSSLPDLDTAMQPFEDPSNPLFLPSPEPSPETPTGNSRFVPGPTPRLHAIVEVPLLSTSMRKRFMRQPSREKKRKLGKDISEASSSLQKSARTNVEIGERLRLALKTEDVAATRLRRRPCLWIDCSHISNAAYKLRIHVQEHVDSMPRGEMIFPCRWKMCGRKFIKPEALSQHLQNHVRKFIICSYQGCDGQFAHPLMFHDHVEASHKNGKLRPASTPFQHVPAKRIPPLKTMLSFHDVHLPVQMQRLTKERRAKIGPWVAKNMYGVVNFSVPLHKSPHQNPRGGRRNGGHKESDLSMKGGWHDKYDFLEIWDASYPQYCDDLESLKATESVGRGILLAPDADGPRGPLGEQYFTSLAERLKESDVQKYAVQEDHESEEAEHNEVKSEEREDGLSHTPPPGLEVAIEQIQSTNTLTDETTKLQQPEVGFSQDDISKREEIMVASVL